MEKKVNSSVVGNRVTMKFGPSVPVGTESILVLCSVLLHHFISLGTAGGLVDKLTAFPEGKGRWGMYLYVIPTSHTDFVSPIPLFLSALMSSQCYGKANGYRVVSVFVDQH